MTIYETDVGVIRPAEGEHDIKIRRTRATAVVEQRVSHFLMGLALFGTMTGPLLVVLNTMPTALFAGVFFVVGVSTLSYGLAPPPSVSTNMFPTSSLLTLSSSRDSGAP